MIKQINVKWLQLATCSGCAVSILNSTSPNIKNILIDELLPGKHINLLFMSTIMGSSGTASMEILLNTKSEPKDYVLVVEGAVPEGKYGEVGEYNMEELLLKLVENSSVIISLGSCASFGGIPKGKPNPTNARSVSEILNINKINKHLINIPGCPSHPDWFVNTVAYLLLKGIPDLDELNRPKMFFGKLVHELCERRPYFDKGKFAKKFGEEGCLYELGCKGPYTHADCPIRSWNSALNWCIQNGSPCFGCCEPEFPDLYAFYKKTKWEEEKL